MFLFLFFIIFIVGYTKLRTICCIYWVGLPYLLPPPLFVFGNLTWVAFGNVTGGEIFGNVTSVAFGEVTSIDKRVFFGDVTANRLNMQ